MSKAFDDLSPEFEAKLIALRERLAAAGYQLELQSAQQEPLPAQWEEQ